jgi:hypothetical protein
MPDGLVVLPGSKQSQSKKMVAVGALRIQFQGLAGLSFGA